MEGHLKLHLQKMCSTPSLVPCSFLGPNQIKEFEILIKSHVKMTLKLFCKTEIEIDENKKPKDTGHLIHVS